MAMRHVHRHRIFSTGMAAFSIFLLVSGVSAPSYGQVATNITSSGLGTIVTPGITTTITGGTRPQNGANLFHSFGAFSIGSGETAQFTNTTPAIPTNNILSRVTGGSLSDINGTINTLSYPTANFYLINPAGIVFGPTASVNVGGSANFSTADYLRLADGVRFNAISSSADALLSIAPVAAFGFLTSSPVQISINRKHPAPVEREFIDPRGRRYHDYGRQSVRLAWANQSG